MKLFTTFKKWIACLILVAFIGTQFTPNVAAGSIQGLGAHGETPLLRQPLPAELGSINEHFPGTNGKTVVLIQDAHASLSVQRNIRDLIDYFNRTYGVQQLLLEGASQKIEPELYKLFNSKSANATFSERLFEMGEFTGAEKFMFDQMLDAKCGARCVKALGMENSSDYVRDVKLFRTIVDHQDEIGKGLDQLTLLFEKTATHKLNSKLLGFLKQIDRTQKTESFSLEYLNVVTSAAHKELALDFENPKNQIKHPMLVRYFRLKAIEKQISTEFAEADKARLLAWMKQKKIKPELIHRIQSLSEKSPNIRSLLEEFYREVSSQGFDFKAYPKWTEWAGFHGLMQEIQPETLSLEVEKIEHAVFKKLVQHQSEAEVLKLHRKIHFLRKLMRLELARNEWKKIQARSSELKPSTIFAQIERQTSANKNQDQAFEMALQFYKTATTRETAFIRSLESQVTSHKSQVTSHTHDCRRFSPGRHSQSIETRRLWVCFHYAQCWRA